MFGGPWQPSGRSTWPEAENAVEHGYMRLPGKRKMIKIRQTVYEDPGNPFADELEAERATQQHILSSQQETMPLQPGKVSPAALDSECGQEIQPLAEKPGRSYPAQSSHDPYNAEQGEISPTTAWFSSILKEGGPDEDVSDRDSRPPSSFFHGPRMVHAPKLTRQGRPDLQRRSMSLALPSESSRPDSDEYVSPRRVWRRENSLPLTSQLEKVEEDVVAPKSGARDTKFYGFYEDLIKGYDRYSNGSK